MITWMGHVVWPNYIVLPSIGGKKLWKSDPIAVIFVSFWVGTDWCQGFLPHGSFHAAGLLYHWGLFSQLTPGSPPGFWFKPKFLKTNISNGTSIAPQIEQGLTDVSAEDGLLHTVWATKQPSNSLSQRGYSFKESTSCRHTDARF